MSTRVAIVGNCQAIGLAHCLRWLCPDIEVADRGWGMVRTSEQGDEAAAGLRGFDIIVTQKISNPLYGDLQTERLRERFDRFVLFPKLVFTGFHPDLVKLWPAASPLGERHSALILAAYHMGLPPQRAAELFNAYIYAVAGYFEEFAKAETYLLRAARFTSTPLDEQLPQWKQRGVFVYIPNHPAVWVLMSIAERLAAQLDLPVSPPEEELPDPLAQSVIWPVYPEIARRLDVEGSLRFKPPGGPHKAAIELDEMIERSYRTYAEYDPAELQAPGVADLAAKLRAEGI